MQVAIALEGEESEPGVSLTPLREKYNLTSAPSEGQFLRSRVPVCNDEVARGGERGVDIVHEVLTPLQLVL